VGDEDRHGHEELRAPRRVASRRFLEPWHHAAVKKAAKPSKKKPAAHKPAAKAKPPARKPAKPPARKPATPPARKPPARKPPARKPPARKLAPRADLGAPVDGWFAKRPQPQRAIAEALRKLVQEAEPGAVGSIKWGMPFYTLDGEMWCAIAAFKSHVNLIMAGAPETFDDPEGRLEGKTGTHIKLRTLEDLPREAVRGWLRSAARRARGG